MAGRSARLAAVWVGIASILIGTAWSFLGLARGRLRLALMGFAALAFGMAIVLGAPVSSHRAEDRAG